MKHCILGALCIFFFQGCIAAETPYKTENVVLITMDGLRWQELFYGAEKELLFSDQYTKKAAEVRQKFWHQSAQKRARELMPFFWNTLIKQGLVVGDRRRASEANITNEMGFSSPGYHEILAGFADPDLVTNASEWNKHVTLLEWAEKQPGFGGRVAAFGSWNKLAYVLNTKRATAVYHNYAHEEAKQTAAAELTATEHMLNQLQRDIPARWRNVRNDAFTHHYALEYIKKAKPRLVHIAYGETDDFAHDGRYDEYLSAAYLNDRFIGELWNYLQTDPHYRGKTTLLITTDHGRGHQPLETWQHHATAKALKGYQKHLAKYGDIVGSEHVWVVAIGPDTPALGLVQTEQPWGLNQIAATIATLLGLDYNAAQPLAGRPLAKVLGK